MQRRGRRWARGGAAAVVAVVLTACGSSDDEEGAADDGATTTAVADLDRYCARLAEYMDATNIDLSTVESTLNGFADAADAARAVAQVAPVDVREAHEKLAAGAEGLVAGLRARAPQTMDELLAAGDEISADLEAASGDLAAESDAVASSAEERCDLTIE